MISDIVGTGFLQKGDVMAFESRGGGTKELFLLLLRKQAIRKSNLHVFIPMVQQRKD